MHWHGSSSTRQLPETASGSPASARPVTMRAWLRVTGNSNLNTLWEVQQPLLGAAKRSRTSTVTDTGGKRGIWHATTEGLQSDSDTRGKHDRS